MESRHGRAGRPWHHRLTWINIAHAATAHYVKPESVIAKFPVAQDSPNMPSADAIEASITRVLEAEATALDAVARARDDATAIAEQARERVRRLGLHTDRRIRAVRAAFEARVATEVAALEAQAAALDATHDLTPEEVDLVEAAVLVTARTMTGGAP